MKPVCKRVIVVEGKYDKIRLESCLDATVITTEGFGIFKNEEKRALLRSLAKTRGLVLLSDSDGAGKLIRSHLRSVIGSEGVTDLYIPPVKGKERRKSGASREGLLGVEGMENETILALFEKSGLLSDTPREGKGYTKLDLYRLGYSGKEESAEKRRRLLASRHLPENLSANAFLEVVNLMEIPLEEESVQEW